MTSEKENLSRAAIGFTPTDDFVEDKMDLNKLLVKNPAATFFVRVAGEAMREAGIFPGDIAVVDRSLPLADGKIIIAMLDGEFIIKRFKKRQNKFFLLAENQDCQPLEITAKNDFEVWGIVTSVLHRF